MIGPSKKDCIAKSVLDFYKLSGHGQLQSSFVIFYYQQNSLQYFILKEFLLVFFSCF